MGRKKRRRKEKVQRYKPERTPPSPAARFFTIARRLPLELQMILCYHVGLDQEIIPGKYSEVAFKELARRFWCSSIKPMPHAPSSDPPSSCC